MTDESMSLESPTKQDTLIIFGDGTWATRLDSKIAKNNTTGEMEVVLIFQPGTMMFQFHPHIKKEYSEKNHVYRSYPKRLYLELNRSEYFPVVLILCDPDGNDSVISELPYVASKNESLKNQMSIINDLRSENSVIREEKENLAQKYDDDDDKEDRMIDKIIIGVTRNLSQGRQNG